MAMLATDHLRDISKCYEMNYFKSKLTKALPSVESLRNKILRSNESPSDHNSRKKVLRLQNLIILLQEFDKIDRTQPHVIIVQS